MDHEEVGRYWDANAEAWTRPVRAGYDVYRDRLNTPEHYAYHAGQIAILKRLVG